MYTAMKIKIFIYISSVIISSIFFVNALENKNLPSKQKINIENYTICKKSALKKRDKTMIPALKEYVSSSDTITKKTVDDFDKIKWYIGSSYRSESKRIQDERNKEMTQINKKITDTRLSAQATWKAEDSLCDYLYNKASTTSQKITKTKKKITRI